MVEYRIFYNLPRSVYILGGKGRATAHHSFQGKNTGAGCHSLLERIFLTKGLNLICIGNGKQSLYIDIRGAPDNKESDSIVNMGSVTPLSLFSNIHFALDVQQPQGHSKLTNPSPHKVTLPSPSATLLKAQTSASFNPACSS